MLTFQTDPSGAVAVAGRLDAAEAANAQSFLDGVEGSVTLHCARLEYISSAGLGVLLKTHKRLSAQGGGLRLAGLSHHIRDILEYSGLDMILQVEPAAE